jgi:hypothetical protein
MDIAFTVNLWFMLAIWLLGVVIGMMLAVGKHR